MPTIRILPDRVANQIAAGEVVERPAAVVRELVENSLDAGATRVTVEFAHGGRSLMGIEDNGRGMDRDDALLALERHATSKIAEATDLDALHTFGFRGEAVPSIASVSRFEMKTRPAAAETGTEILVNGGKFVHVRDCGMPPGTRITVANLFHPVPARRKFLKSDSTEAAHIIQCVRFYALAHPEVAFTLIEDGRTIFQSPPCRSLLERVAAIFGRQTAEALLPVEAACEGMRLTGLIGKPGASRGSRHEMITFVNRRPVDTKTLAYALIESYQQHLPKGRYPLAFLFLEIEPQSVDVNVHPAKREVRFRNDPGVRTFVVRSLLDALRQAAGDLAAALPPGAQRVTPLEPLPSAVRPPVAGAAAQHAPLPAIVLPATARDRVGGKTDTGLETRATTALPADVVSGLPEPLARPTPAIAPILSATTEPAVASVPDAIPGEGRPGALAGWRHLGTALGGECEIFETPAGVVLLDRRAALERVLFEQLQREFRDGATLSQRLLFAVPVELDPIAAAMLADQLAFLEQHGLEVSAFGRNFFRIESAPAWLDPAEAEPFLRDILARLREGQLDPRRPAVAREELARLAAARAVRGGARADTGAELVARLLACDQPLLTPGGRPTLIELSRGELTRRFQKDRC